MLFKMSQYVYKQRLQAGHWVIDLAKSTIILYILYSKITYTDYLLCSEIIFCSSETAGTSGKHSYTVGSKNLRLHYLQSQSDNLYIYIYTNTQLWKKIFLIVFF